MRSIYKSMMCVMLCMCFIIYAPAAMANSAKAKVFIQDMSNKVITIAAEKKLSDKSKEQKLNELFIKTVDIKWIAKFVVGRYWRQSSKEQQDKYTEEYSKFLLSSYVPKFRDYTDQKITIGKVIAEGDGEYIVETTIEDKDGKSYRVSYRLREASSTFKVYDIIAEGISMITTQRSEYGSILDREGMDSLIAKLESRN